MDEKQLKALTEDIPKMLTEETHDPWTGEPKSAARDLAEEAFGPTDSEKRRQEARSAAHMASRRWRWNGLWRKGAGTADDPNNGRLIFRILGFHPSRWTCSREWFARDLWPRPIYYVRTLWYEITRYHYETCQRCGRAHGETLDTYWLADDALWVEIVGHDGGCLCPRCFTKAARRRGVCVYWKPLVWLRQPEVEHASA